MPISATDITNTNNTENKSKDKGQLRKIKKVRELGRPIMKNEKRDRPRQLLKHPQRNNIARVKKFETREKYRAIWGKHMPDIILAVDVAKIARKRVERRT